MAGHKTRHRHGKIGRSGELGFDNADLKAYPSLYSNPNKDLMEARKAGCALRKAQNPDAIKSAVRRILKNEQALSLNFNALWELLHRMENEYPEDVNEEIKEELLKSGVLTGFLIEKLKISGNLKTFVIHNFLLLLLTAFVWKQIAKKYIGNKVLVFFFLLIVLVKQIFLFQNYH